VGVEYRVLGPLEALQDGRELRLGGPRPRAVLAILLLHAGEVVPSTRLIDSSSCSYASIRSASGRARC
jgi:DNA-binding SARP family transcriptional activator